MIWLLLIGGVIGAIAVVLTGLAYLLAAAFAAEDR